MKSCEARQYSDQKVCHRCNLVWDMNDPEPPECRPEPGEKQRGRAAIEQLRRSLGKESSTGGCVTGNNER